jgi:hypothetical protein
VSAHVAKRRGLEVRAWLRQRRERAERIEDEARRTYSSPRRRRIRRGTSARTHCQFVGGCPRVESDRVSHRESDRKAHRPRSLQPDGHERSLRAGSRARQEDVTTFRRVGPRQRTGTRRLFQVAAVSDSIPLRRPDPTVPPERSRYCRDKRVRCNRLRRTIYVSARDGRCAHPRSRGSNRIRAAHQQIEAKNADR